MYRIILVDDEPLILAGIASLVDWNAEECIVVGKATNGSSAIKMINELKPDIVITDIRMPVLNGLEMVAKCQAAGCKFSFIVLTNLEEFELAKQAIMLGATDYLVKLNLSPDELIQSLNKAKESCDLLFQKEQRTFSSSSIIDVAEQAKIFLHSYLFSDNNSANYEIIPVNMPSYPFIIMVSIRQDTVLFDTDGGEVQNIPSTYVNQQVSDIIQSIAKRSFQSPIILLEYSKDTYLLAGSLNSASYNEFSYHTLISQFCTKLQHSLKNYFEYSAVYGISNPKAEFPLIREALLEAQTALTFFYYDASDTIIFYNGQEIHHSNAKAFNINFLKKDLCASIQKNDALQLSNIFTQIIDLFAECKPNKQHATSACINIYTYLYSFFETPDNSYEDIFPYTINIAEQLNRFHCLADILEWLNHFAEKLSKLLTDRQNTRSDKLIEMAKKYIEEHYNEKISLAEVSVFLNISPSYLSTNFKKYTNTTLSDYIAEVKIERAKEMIDTHQYLIYEISDMLGFDNPYYFSKVFKKVTGISPREHENRTQ